jgi:hypothetical protein
MPDLDNGSDPQDEAEAYDETHGADEDPAGLFADDTDGDPQLLTDVFDVTSADGDADDDEDEDEEADEYSASELDGLDLDDDEDEADRLDDELGADQPEYEAVDGLDRRIDRAAERAAPSEPGLVYTDNLDSITYPRDDEAEKYESTRQLSDEQLADLGYLEADRPNDNLKGDAMKDDQDTISTKEEGSENWEDRSFGTDAESAVLEGSGASADDVEDEADPDEDERLDEGLEETFPASDPVSAKHIT